MRNNFYSLWISSIYSLWACFKLDNASFDNFLSAFTLIISSKLMISSSSDLLIYIATIVFTYSIWESMDS